MNIKIVYHIMPWEIDYALLTFTQLKKSKYHLPDNVNITIDSALNLSSYLIDWDESKLPKEFFIEKYNQLLPLLKDYNHNSKIYDGDELYGHLDLQRDSMSSEVDYYMGICPDIYFNEHVLAYLVKSLEHIEDEYFILTPQIPRMWDSTWDILTNEKYLNHPNELWDSIDIFDIANDEHPLPTLTHLGNNMKWAGWFDIYSKSFFEKLVPIQPEWHGYGAWDFYGLNVVDIFKHLGGKVKQYILNNQVIFEYCVGPLKTEDINGFSNYYKKFLKIIPNQGRNDFSETIHDKLKQRFPTLYDLL
jgi:hypothetical protein